MNLVRFLLAPTVVGGLALGLTACKPDKPNGTTNPPGEGGGVADSGDVGSGDTMDDPSGDSGASDGAADTGDAASDGDGGQKCEAKVADAPTALFEERVLVRVPMNVELVEDNPAFATTFQAAGFVSVCDATVKQMNVLKFSNDKKKKLTAFVDEFISDYLVKGGYTNGDRGENIIETDTDVHTVVEYPAAGGQPATKMYIAATRKLDFIIIATYLASPEEFEMLQPTFKESGSRILVVPAG